MFIRQQLVDKLNKVVMGNNTDMSSSLLWGSTSAPSFSGAEAIFFQAVCAFPYIRPEKSEFVDVVQSS